MITKYFKSAYISFLTFLSDYQKVQLLDVKLRADRVQNVKTCDDVEPVEFKTNWLRVDLPQVLTLTVCSIISAIIANKLYQQFGWSVYKRIGSDLKIQSKCFLVCNLILSVITN